MFPYAVEQFTAEEQDVLRRYVTNLDRPVFALVNLPEVVKGALFARYSRSPKSLRRLFLDEFVDELDISGDASVDATVGMRRAGRSLRAGVQRVRGRFGGSTRRGASCVRAMFELVDQGARVGTIDGVPRAVDPVHRVQQPPRQRSLPVLPRPGGARLAARRPLRGRDGPDVRHLRPAPRGVAELPVDPPPARRAIRTSCTVAR